MKISEVKNIPCVNFRVETKTDAHLCISKQKDVERFIAQHGDVEVERDFRDLGLFRVPAFKADIEAYCKMKAAHCARYGSN
jgi:hypothetical protein